MKNRILLVEDEENLLLTLRKFLSQADYDVTAVGDVDKALTLIGKREFDLVLADILFHKDTGIDILVAVKEKYENCPVILITGAPSIDTAAKAVRLGAFDYLPKPVRKEKILNVVATALKFKEAVDDTERYRSNLDSIFRAIGDVLILVDKNMVVLEANNAVQKVCGRNRSSMLGKQYNEVTKYCSLECVNVFNATLNSGQESHADRIECNFNGSPAQVVSISTSPILDAKGEINGAAILIKDETHISSLKQALMERKNYLRIVGRSEAMQGVYSLIENVANIDSTVLIAGESGTGKELVAEAIHYSGVRGKGPLVKVNCSALSENLLESELFGHAKGAFTGAVTDRIGRFQMADKGTIFLDEIGDISSAIQLRLLRVLQDKEVERVGDAKPIKVDVRVIAATNRNLNKLVERGGFRQDLYYRIKVVEIPVPPLRERKDDIPVLVRHFLGKLNGRLGKNIKGVSANVMRVLIEHDWPGNVRELEHALERAVAVSVSNIITRKDMPSDLVEAAGTEEPGEEYSADSVRQNILHALEQTAWNKSKTAKLLGLSRVTLYRRMRKLGISSKNNDV